MIKLIVPLDREERQALLNLAENEKRDPRLQAALIIRRELEKRKLLPPRNLKPTTEEAAHDCQAA